MAASSKKRSLNEAKKDDNDEDLSEFLESVPQKRRRLNNDEIGDLDDGEDKEHIIKLNIGGMKFETTNATLNNSGYFRVLLSGKFGDKPGNDGYYFIDR